jgi:hypothetical protein
MNHESIKNNFFIPENKTFNKICGIQKLIKKEAAMKKLCKYKHLFHNISFFNIFSY